MDGLEANNNKIIKHGPIKIIFNIFSHTFHDILECFLLIFPFITFIFCSHGFYEDFSSLRLLHLILQPMAERQLQLPFYRFMTLKSLKAKTECQPCNFVC